MKLKKTAEGILVNHTNKGVWGTYGGLRRACEDADAILCHRIRENQVMSFVLLFYDFPSINGKNTLYV